MSNKTFESYDTGFGKIFIAAKPYCKDCRKFKPMAHLSWVGPGLRPKYDEYHDPLYDGTMIRCENEFMCQNLRDYLKEKMKGESDESNH